MFANQPLISSIYTLVVLARYIDQNAINSVVRYAFHISDTPFYSNSEGRSCNTLQHDEYLAPPANENGQAPHDPLKATDWELDSSHIAQKSPKIRSAQFLHLTTTMIPCRRNPFSSMSGRAPSLKEASPSSTAIASSSSPTLKYLFRGLDQATIQFTSSIKRRQFLVLVHLTKAKA